MGTKFKFDEDFIKNYDANSNKGFILLEVDVEYPKNLKICIMIYHF